MIKKTVMILSGNEHSLREVVYFIKKLAVVMNHGLELTRGYVVF